MWGAPENLHDVRAFLGFANFYRRFIKDYSTIVVPIVAVTRKDHKFFWSNECEKAFHFLKDSFALASVLSHFDPDKEIIVETDASDYVSVGILSQ
jgi:hypothetical protein